MKSLLADATAEKDIMYEVKEKKSLSFALLPSLIELSLGI